MTPIEGRPLTERVPDHAPHPAPIAAPQPADVLAAACVELGRLLGALDALLGGLDDATWRARPAPHEWAPVEIVCHLRDEEREDVGARVRVVVQGGARFAPIDPERWAVERRYRDQVPAQARQDLRTARAESLDFLDSIAPERLAAAVEHPALGRLSGLDLLVAWVTHDRLHLRQLAGTLARQWLRAERRSTRSTQGRSPTALPRASRPASTDPDVDTPLLPRRTLDAPAVGERVAFSRTLTEADTALFVGVT